MNLRAVVGSRARPCPRARICARAHTRPRARAIASFARRAQTSSAALSAALLAAACGADTPTRDVAFDLAPADALTSALTSAPSCPARAALLAAFGAWVELAPLDATGAATAPRARARVCELAREESAAGVRLTGACLLPDDGPAAVTLVYGRRELRLAEGALRWAEYTRAPFTPADGAALDFTGVRPETRFDADGDGIGNLVEECLGRDALVADPLSPVATGTSAALTPRAPALPAPLPARR